MLCREAIDAAFFYAHSSIVAGSLTSLPPYAYSQWTAYSGHIFWDSDMWTGQPIALAAPASGRAIASFRTRTVEAAKRRAASYGFGGAAYPWESVPPLGDDGTPPDANTAYAEQHVTPDVAVGVWEQANAIGAPDSDFITEEVWPVLREVARWIVGRATETARGWELLRLLGPNEMIPDVDNDSCASGLPELCMPTSSLHCQ